MRILLVCNAGMSTSMLVNKMKQYADQNGIPLEITARGINGLRADDVDADVVLLGPQVGYRADALRAALDPSIPLGVMDMKDYGRQNCKNIFAMIDELMGK
ncbi:MAG: PTS sugar transporter subunit IIB [Olegusella sp.]|nr:PTS sugar transporter subunit IIB [Olegusella sp.]